MANNPLATVEVWSECPLSTVRLISHFSSRLLVHRRPPLRRSAMSPPTPTSAPGRGIDVRDALSILAARTERGGEDLASASVPAALKAMGQTIDIAKQMEFAQPNAAGCDCAKNGSATNGADASGANALSEEEKQKHEAVKELRARRGAEIRAQLRTMGVGELLGMIFGAQQERVATYKAFEE